MHSLVFLEPGHFHAALTLGDRHPRVRDEIEVYATEGPELRDFLTLVDRFNRRPERPTRWRPVLRTGADPLARLIEERPGDVAIVAGQNHRKMAWIGRLHDAGFHVLADKPWMVTAGALPELHRILTSGPLVLEMMTGRHDVATAVETRLVRERAVFGAFRPEAAGAAIELESVHHLQKLVDGAPLRRPAWFFDVRIQGDGLADMPTHLVNHAQGLLAETGVSGPLEPIFARRWPTLVPRATFAQITGLPDFPPELRGSVEDEQLRYLGNGEIAFRQGSALVRLSARWDLVTPPGGGDAHRTLLHGTSAAIRVESGPMTGWTRRILVVPRVNAAAAEAALGRAIAGWQHELPGLGLARRGDGIEVVIPAALNAGHERHFPLVLNELLSAVEAGGASPRAEVTLAKYELLARAQAWAGTA
jgi:Putative oxidoreductase C terminal domain